MGKLGYLTIFTVVAIAHFFILQTYIEKKVAVSKPKAKIYHITLSSVVVKKPVSLPPKPKVEPIILPPDPEPVIKPEPIILPPDPEPIIKPKPKKKKKRKKRAKKRKKIVKPIIKKEPEPIIEEVIAKPVPISKETITKPQPMVEQIIAPQQTIDTASIKDAYINEIRIEIKRHLYYPKMAKRLHMEGVAHVAFRVLKDGSITNIRVINATKKLLAKGAKKTLNMLSLKPIPSVLNESFLDINIPIEFRLIRR